MNHLPLFQYPINVGWVDDDPLFLKVAESVFKGQKQKFFPSSGSCLDFFMSYAHSPTQIPFLRGVREDENYDCLGHAPVDFNVTNIAKLKNYSNLSKEIGVLICDYSMPEINGLELAEKLSIFPVKKILLTGVAPDLEIISAFNKNLIDKFICKGSPSLRNEIQMYVKILTWKYFSDLTIPLLAHLEADFSLPLSDPIFINFFNAWCDKNKISEFYLIDKDGSFLTIDENGKTRYLIVHTDRSITRFNRIYSENIELQLLTNSIPGKIPFFGYGKEAWQVPLKNWNKHFYNAEILLGREKYYWTIV